MYEIFEAYPTNFTPKPGNGLHNRTQMTLIRQIAADESQYLV